MEKGSNYFIPCPLWMTNMKLCSLPPILFLPSNISMVTRLEVQSLTFVSDPFTQERIHQAARVCLVFFCHSFYLSFQKCACKSASGATQKPEEENICCTWRVFQLWFFTFWYDWSPFPILSCLTQSCWKLLRTVAIPPTLQTAGKVSSSV